MRKQITSRLGISGGASFFLAASLFVLAIPSAHAQDDPDCANAATQMEMTRCAYLDWQAADAEMNAAYKTAMAKMRGIDSGLSDDLKGAAQALTVAQRAWLPYRDKACEAYGFIARGGTMESQLVNICLTDLTRQRAQQLQDLARGLGE